MLYFSLLHTTGPQLKVIATMSVGVDHIDLPECAKRNIKVGHTPDVSTNAVAEETVGLLIATARKFKEGLYDSHARLRPVCSSTQSDQSLSIQLYSLRYLQADKGWANYLFSLCILCM